ncbi:YaiI/YqxD family protein [Alkalicoccus halolimnae]|uniref:UPF0178 protein FTX54_007040 n=1 Tax=Alkalicoccus halolimnae TaxID=1667239 RepID=A0A5C7F6W1_9BACI|nr:DUF188 domain-containing protein [Alkalicoccus halolimnae]TXF86432.1 hypothetical protein FTX54_04170 [Alkalicoccus halolimnae]
MLTIFIDADASPVVNEVLTLRKKLNVNVILVHSRSHMRREKMPDDVKSIIVEDGRDAADYEIAGRVTKGDIVITEDLGLTAIVLAKQAVVINSFGKKIDQMQMDSLLEVRHAAQKMRRSGKNTKGPKKRRQQDQEQFIKGLREVVELLT